MLGEFQALLEKRFAELAAMRRDLQYPIYALEHGLEEGQLRQVQMAASNSIRYNPPDDAHWLVWTSLSAEAGYSYSGDEFWPALERRPGEWRSNEYRQKLRKFFHRFQRVYQGPTPEGRWAEHFNIIAWPITNAILPRYLQTHFARHIYDLRFELTHYVTGNGEEIGQFLLSNYDGTPSRFHDFLQQTDLTTQIVLALRDEDLGGQVHRIDPSLLSRIVSDLETHRDAKYYLRDARKLIQSTGIQISSRLKPASTTISGLSANQPVSSANQRTRLAARRNGNGQYLLGIQLPDIRAALKGAGVDEKQLSSHRVQFFGPAERYLPGSTLLSLSKKERPLHSFPQPNQPIYFIENATENLSKILDPIGRIEERPTWILKRQADGLFIEVGHVRSCQEYLVLCRADIPAELLGKAGILQASIATQEVYAYHLTMPTKLSDAQKTALRDIGIGTVVGVLIEPIGFNPIPGACPSWLSTEPVFLRLSADYHVDGFSVALDSENPQRFAASGSKALIRLDQLKPGRHSIYVLLADKKETFDFQIVAPQPWKDSIQNKAGFRLFIEPANAKLEHLLGGQANVQVHGPKGRAIQWSFETYNASGHLAHVCPLRSTKVGGLQSVISTMLDKARKDHSDKIDEAYRVDLVACLDELGRQALKFTHSVEPLRWKFDPKDHTIRLIDETDHTEPILVRSYLLEAPMKKEPIDIDNALSGIPVNSPGTLFAVTHKQVRISIFASVPRAIRDFTDLGFEQAFQLPESKAEAMIKLIDNLRLWDRAKPVGDLALVRKAATKEKFHHEIAALACGSDFADLIKANDENKLDEARAKVGGSPGFRVRMRKFEWPSRFELAQQSFAEYAATYGVEADAKICASVLSLARKPLCLRFDSGVDAKAYIAGLLSRRILLRGAFLANASHLIQVPFIEKETA